MVLASPGLPVRPHFQHSHEIVVKESVQGLSHCGGICTMVGIEASASNERLDFALAQFDAEEPQPLASTFAVPKHTGGRRRTRQLFRGRRELYCPGIMIHQCNRSPGRICFPFTSRKISEILRQWESHRLTLADIRRKALPRGCTLCRPSPQDSILRHHHETATTRFRVHRFRLRPGMTTQVSRRNRCACRTPRRRCYS